jgi:hypothetical protein
LLERTLAGQSDFTLTEAVAVVLLTWNRRFYIRKDTPDFDAQHVKDIDNLLAGHGDALAGYRARSIDSLLRHTYVGSLVNGATSSSCGSV